ncbi:MAG: hypothetical protein AB7O57_16000 [Hyphomicrobiaceae bacterium]
MKLKTLALGLALALAATAPALAQRGPGSWELLGEERVGFGAERDVINVGRGEDYFRGRSYRKLRFVASGGEVRMRSIRLHFINGQSEDVEFNQTLRPGQEIDVDLRGERSYLRQIEMFYKAKFGLNIGGGGINIAQPTIKVFAENVRGGAVAVAPPPPPPRPGFGGGFEEVARQRFDRRDERVDIRVGRGEGRFGQLRLRNGSSDRIDLIEARIRFANGQTQAVRLSQTLEGGELTSPIDLEGDQRSVEVVTVTLNPRRRPGPAELVLLGTGRPGRDAGPHPGSGPPPVGFRPRPGWQLLGQQSVGFGIDRDVIRVAQGYDWRDRGYDRLHFVAENNDLHMVSVRVVYQNGYGEDFRVDRLIREGSDLAIDLPGRRSHVREIEMVYRARPGFGGRAAVSVFGESSRR